MPMRKVDMLTNGLVCVANIMIVVVNALDYKNHTSTIRRHAIANAWAIGSTATCLCFVCYTIPLIAMGVAYCKRINMFSIIWLNTAAYFAFSVIGLVILFGGENEWLDEIENMESAILIYAGCALTSTTLTFSARGTIKGERRGEGTSINRPQPVPTSGNTRNLGVVHVSVK